MYCTLPSRMSHCALTLKSSGNFFCQNLQCRQVMYTCVHVICIYTCRGVHVICIHVYTILCMQHIIINALTILHLLNQTGLPDVCLIIGDCF